jgi:NADPH:quinone reductase-like Zn-dependent oxidoreductase
VPDRSSADSSGGRSILLPTTMAAVLLTGHGGLDKLEYRTDVRVPHPQQDEVLIQVVAAGINNTDVNTRIGWYSKAVTADTAAGGAAGFDTADKVDATWSGTALSSRVSRVRTSAVVWSTWVPEFRAIASANEFS